MTEEKYRTHELCQFDYSDIWKKSIYENCTDTPLRNNEIINLLNTQEETIQKQKERIKELEQFIIKLSTDGDGRIYLANGYGYKVSAILTDYNGDTDD